MRDVGRGGQAQPQGGGGSPPVLSPGDLATAGGNHDSRDVGDDSDVDRAEPADGDTDQRQPDGGVPTGPVGAVLEPWRRGRLDPGRRGVVALGLVALVAALIAGTVVLRSRPHEVSAPPVVTAGVPVPGSANAAGASADIAAAGGKPGGPSAAPAGVIVVAVGGRVVRPGLVRLPVGSRVDDAVRAVGGALPGADLGSLNLARRLVDGEQVQVGVPQPAASAGASGPATLLDLNAATLQQLDVLPGIGPVLAQKVLDWRTEHGRFDSVDQLREVPGIGESKYAELKGKVSV